MPVPFRVSSLTFNGGSSVDTRDADIVVIVGPNNTGKSRTLQEMLTLLSLEPGQPRPANTFFVLDNVAIAKTLSGAGVAEWLKARRYWWVDANDLQERVRTVGAQELYVGHTAGAWDAGGDYLGILASHLIRSLWCGERLGYLGSPSRLDPGAHPDHPIHWLLREPALMGAFRESFWKAFGMHVIVDGWGSSIRLRLSPDHVQDDFQATSTDGLPQLEVVERLAALPLIESQSDGVRSFAGMILTLLAAQYPLVLLDEPEAFLHPPQARLLGRSLAEVQGEGQLFVATHSLDVLLGLVEARPEKVLILRLTREHGRTTCQTLPREKLAELWRDPLLRFSRALDGLFHDGVVVGEGDTDSQFYSAITAGNSERSSASDGRHVMFTYAGSKQRIPLITNALRAVGVPVRAIVDFDVLSDEGVLRSLVEGLGVEYRATDESDRRLVDAHLRGSAPAPRVGAMRDAIDVILGNDATRELTSAELRKLRAVAEPQSGWRAAKSAGRAAVPPGDASVALERLLERLGSIGLFVVPTGEVESFVRAVGRKGPRWVVEVVEGGYLERATEAHEFVGSVLASLPGARGSSSGQ